MVMSDILGTKHMLFLCGLFSMVQDLMFVYDYSQINSYFTVSLGWPCLQRFSMLWPVPFTYGRKVVC